MATSKREPDQNTYELRDMLRMWPTLVVAGATCFAVWWYAPQQLPILVYTMAKLSMAGYLGYWLDRWVFPDSRPSVPEGMNENRLAMDPTAAEYRRAGIIIGAMVASGLMS